MKKVITVTAILVLSLVLMSFLVWQIVISEETVVNVLTGAIGEGPVNVRFEGLKKGLFYSITADEAHLNYHNMPTVTLEDLRVALNIDLSADLSANIRGGPVNARVRFIGQRTAHLNVRDVELSDLSGLSVFGISGKGKIMLDMDYSKDSAEFRLKIDKAELSPLATDSALIPLNLFHTVRGAGTIIGPNINIKSIALEGKGISAVLKGVLSKGRSDMDLEIMTHREFEQLPLLEAFVGRYKKSPGFYVVSVKPL